MTLKQRVKAYCDYKNIAITNFERKAGLSNGYFRETSNRMSDDKAMKIQRAFDDLNIDWLRTGNGEMLQQRGHTVIAGDVTGNGNNFVAGNNNTIETSTDQESDKEIPIEETVVVPADIVRAPGYDIRKEFLKGNLEDRAKPTQYIVPSHDMKAYTYCDDMEPEIRAGEPVLIKLLPPGCAISPGDMYFLELPQGGKIRYILSDRDGILHLRAANYKAYGDMWVHRSDVLSIAQVMLIMRTPRSMDPNMTSIMDILERTSGQASQLIEQIDKAGERENRLISILEKKY